MNKNETKLSLDQLKNYLGTKLKIQVTKPDGTLKDGNLRGMSISGNVTYHPIGGAFSGGAKIETVKPYLRPLSSLIEEITVEGYNDSKPFIPMVELYYTMIGNKLLINSNYNLILSDRNVVLNFPVDAGSYDFGYDIENYSFWFHAGNYRHFLFKQLQLFELLFGWHFWPWGEEYFEKGLILKIEE